MELPATYVPPYYKLCVFVYSVSSEHSTLFNKKMSRSRKPTDDKVSNLSHVNTVDPPIVAVPNDIVSQVASIVDEKLVTLINTLTLNA